MPNSVRVLGGSVTAAVAAPTNRVRILGGSVSAAPDAGPTNRVRVLGGSVALSGVSGSAPTPNAGADFNLEPGETITLIAKGKDNDTGKFIKTGTWSIVSGGGSLVNVNSADGVALGKFTAPKPKTTQETTLRLTQIAAGGMPGSDDVKVTVPPWQVWTPGDLGGGGVGPSWASGAYINESNAVRDSFAATRGKPLDLVSVFPTRDSWTTLRWDWWVDDVTGAGPNTIPVIAMPLWAADSSLAATLAGDADADWTAWATDVLGYGLASPIIRLGWEFNVNSMYWRATPANVADWITAYRRIHGLIRAVLPGAVFCWNPNIGASGNQTVTDPTTAYPGDDYVNQIGVDAYDWYPVYNTTANQNQHKTETYGWDFWTNFTRSHGKKFCVPEWGLTSQGGDNPLYINWVKDYLTAQDAQGGLVAWETYFLANQNNTNHTYLLTAPNSLAAYQSWFGTPPPVTATKTFGVYAIGWDGMTNMNTPHANYNTVYLFNAEGRPDGSLVWPWATPTNISTRRAQGTKIILSCGGAGATINFDTRAISQKFVDSVIALHTAWGGTQANKIFDGIDLNTYEANATRNTTEYTWICSQIRAYFGAEFIITCPPAPWNQVDKDFCKTLLDNGSFTYVSPQLYDGGGNPVVPSVSNIVSKIQSWVSEVASGDASKIAVGYGFNPSDPNDYSNITQIQDSWTQLSTQFPNLRGAFVWSSTTDQANSWSVATTMGPVIT